MSGVEAQTFMTQTRKGFKNDNDFDQWMNQNVFYQTYKVLVKAK